MKQFYEILRGSLPAGEVRKHVYAELISSERQG